MNNDRIQRLNIILDYLGAAYSAVAIKSGISPSNLKNMLEGKQTITDKTMHRISEAYPEFNIKWLKDGEGEMLISVPPSSVPVSPDVTSTVAELMATIKGQLDIIKTQQETILELTRRLPKP